MYYEYDQLLIIIITALLGHDNFDVIQTKEPYHILLSIYVEDDDMKYIIGRDGHIAKAMRNLLNGVAGKNGDIVKLIINEGKQK